MGTIAQNADAVRVRISLQKIGQSIADIADRYQPDDFTTRRLHMLALEAFAAVRPDLVAVSDLNKAFITADVAAVPDETPDQHTCRYITRVLQLASENGARRVRAELAEDLRRKEARLAQVRAAPN